jgi:hypothetical protein
MLLFVVCSKLLPLLGVGTPMLARAVGVVGAVVGSVVVPVVVVAVVAENLIKLVIRR